MIFLNVLMTDNKIIIFLYIELIEFANVQKTQICPYDCQGVAKCQKNINVLLVCMLFVTILLCRTSAHSIFFSDIHTTLKTNKDI